MDNIKFRDDAHFQFYIEKIFELKADEYLKSLIYLIGLSDITRKHWNEIYCESEGVIISDVINEGWPTGISNKIMRLAFQLYTDRTITDTNYKTGEINVEECRRYSVTDIFCCEYAPYFVEALKIRYPMYFDL